MAAGDLTATAIFMGTLNAGDGSLEAAISGANLAAATDFLLAMPVPGRDHLVKIIKVERAAA